MHKIMLSFFAAGVLLADDSVSRLISLDTITVSASPVNEHEAFDMPNQIDSIGGEAKTLRATASMGSLLEEVPGINNLSTGSQAGKPVIRGMSGERVKVLSNSNATDFQTYGIRHIANTELFLSERVEAIRGAQGVLYGSDALGGVVNVLSPGLLWAKEGETMVKGEILGEHHTNNAEWTGGAKIQAASGKLGVNAGYVKRKGGNINAPDALAWEPGDPAGTLPRFTGELPYTNFETASALAAIGYTGDRGNFSLQHTWWESYQNYLGHTAAPSFDAIAAAGQKLTNHETQLRGEILLGEWIVKPTLSHTLNRRKAATNVPYESMNGANTDLDIDVDRKDFRLALLHPSFGIFEGEIGVEGYAKTQTLHKGTLVPSADETGRAVYLFEETDIEKWIFQWGLRYDTKGIDAPLEGENATFVTRGVFDANSNSPRFSAFGGSIGATYRLNGHWNIAANLSRGFRAPSIFELYAGGSHGGVQAYQIGNPALTEETTAGGDLSLRYKDEKSQGSLTLYRTHVDSYIYLQNTGYYRDKDGARYDEPGAGRMVEMQNSQTDALMEGIEFSFDTRIADSTRLSGSVEIIRGKDARSDSQLTMMPANNLRLALYQELGSLGTLKNNVLSVEMKAVDDQQIAGSHEPFSQYNTMPFGSADTAGYALWGVGYRTDISLLGETAILGIRVDNLFDTHYRDFLDTYKGYAPGMGRNVSFSLLIPFESNN